MKRKADVGAVRQSSLLLLLSLHFLPVLLPASFVFYPLTAAGLQNSGDELPSDEPSREIAPGKGEGCLEFTPGKIKSYNPWLNGGPVKTFSVIKAGFSDRNAKRVHSLVHPRLGSSEMDLRKIMTTMKLSLGEPFEVSAYRIWHIKEAEKFLKEGVFCQESEARVHPHYGFRTQWAVWFQILGSKELGRVFLTLVQEKGRWLIGYLHFTKWTHAEKDPRSWIEAGDRSLSQGNLIAARVEYTMGRKLLEGNPHFELLVTKHLDHFLLKNLPGEKWLALIGKSLPGELITSADSVFVSGGMGLRITFRLPDERKGPEVRSHCELQLSALEKKIWFKNFKGLRCGYLGPGEPDVREGKMGSLYLAR